MAKNRKKRISSVQEMNMTPLIDCVFLLLIFFMITTVFKNPSQLKLSLPEAQNFSKLDKRQLNLEVSAEGELALDGTILTIDSFDAYLVSEKQKTGTNSLLIKADIGTKHGLVLKIMQIAKGVGIETIALAIENRVEE